MPVPSGSAGRPATRVTGRWASRWAAATIAVALVAVAFLIAWLSRGLPVPPSGSALAWLEPLAAIIAYGVAGAILVDRRPDLPFGWLLSGTAMLLSVQLVALPVAYRAALHGEAGPWVAVGLATGSVAFLPVAVQGLVNVRFPSGRITGWFGRVLEIGLVTGIVAVELGGLLGSGLGSDLLPPGMVAPPLINVDGVIRVADALVVLGPFVVLLGLVAGLAVVVRFLRSRGLLRQQLKWRAVGVLVALAAFPLAVTEQLAWANVIDAPVFVLTLVVPVLRYRLWIVDTIVRRSLVYGSITAVLVLAYLAVAAIVTAAASARIAAPVAAVVVALSFAPLRSRTHRLVERFFYGDRHDPYRTLRGLGSRFQTALPGQMLDGLVEAIGGSLRLPQVAIESTDGTRLAGIDRAGTTGTTGSVSPPAQRWPLRYEGKPAGFLVATPRRGEDGFDERDEALLADMARQIAAAVYAHGLTAELLRSRHRLVSAREEERRRLRRDLHDGLGPILTAIGLHLDALRAGLPDNPHLAEAKEATGQALTELRRLVLGLRPPALDELGLVGAIRSHADRLAAGSGLTLVVEASTLPDLPAAIEVAAYRTAVEALTNTARHSGARHGLVRLGIDDHALVLEVRDDGDTRTAWVAGVGLAAVRERADELGGDLRAGPSADGALVLVRFPLPEPEPEQAPNQAAEREPEQAPNQAAEREPEREPDRGPVREPPPIQTPLTAAEPGR
jgi:two-component system NarL family sensor kinase